MSTSVPYRVWHSASLANPAGLLVAAAIVSFTFAATPFLVADAIAGFDIGVGSAALLSSAQIGGFTIANFAAGRRMIPTARLVHQSTIALAALNLLSALAPSFESLVALRLGAGIPLGLLTWVTWAVSADDGKAKGEVAAIGPLSAAMATPIVALASSAGGVVAIYAMLTVASLAPLVMRMPFTYSGRPPGTRNPIQAPILRLVLASLFLMTGAGSAVFIFVRVIAADRLGLTAMETAIGLSINAVMGIPVAKYSGSRRLPGLWILVIAGCALLLATVERPAVFYLVMALWGMAFWALIPEAFSILSRRSQFPADRIGDAQAVMAFGRVLGPTIGAWLLSLGGFGLLGWACAGLLVISAVLIEVVATEHRWRRADRVT